VTGLQTRKAAVCSRCKRPVTVTPAGEFRTHSIPGTPFQCVGSGKKPQDTGGHVGPEKTAGQVVR
jgi:hypothetical protein